MCFIISFLLCVCAFLIFTQENNYRKIEQQTAVDKFSTENIFPINKVNTGFGVWIELNPNIPRTNYVGVSFLSPETGWAAGVGGVIIKTTNGEEDWSVSNVPTSNTLLKVNSYNGNNVSAAGYYDIDFNASGLTSGIYFYRLKAEGVNGRNFNSIKKMIVIK